MAKIDCSVKVLTAAHTYFRDIPSGAARLAYDVAHEMAKRGYEVWMLVQDLTNTGRPYEVDDGVTVVRYNLAPAGRFNLGRHRAHIHQAQSALRQFATGPFDVVHGHTPLQYLAALRFSQKQGVRTCYTIHSPAYLELKIEWLSRGWPGRLKGLFGLPFVARLERRCLESSMYLTCESDYTQRLVHNLYGAELAKGIIRIPGWVDLDRFRPAADPKQAKSQLGWPVDRPVLFTLRRLAARMGLDNLLRALRIVRSKGFEFHMVIGGSGPLRGSLERLAQHLELNDVVTFLGSVDEEILPRAYAACDAFIIPTADLECFGIITLEALACGRPVLATPVGALPEIVGRFEPRWIAHSATLDGLASLILDFFSGHLPQHSPDDLRTWVAEHFPFERAMDRYEKILLGRAPVIGDVQ